MAKAILILAEGFEEIEAITPLDVLRRAGVDCKTAGLGSKQITAAHGVTVQADLLVSEIKDLPDAVILPGGMPGSANLGGSSEVKDLVMRAAEAGKLCAAICAAPVLTLGAWGLLDGRDATCFPGMENQFPASVRPLQESVVEDGNFITSRGVGTAMAFALTLVARLVSPEVADEHRKRMVVS